jgi:hypothetical protein
VKSEVIEKLELTRSQRLSDSAQEIQKLSRSKSAILKLPETILVEGSHAIPAPLSPFIPENAAQKLASNKPLVVHVHCLAEEFLIHNFDHTAPPVR